MTPLLVSRGDGLRKKGGSLHLPQTLEAHVDVVTSAVAGTDPLLPSEGLACTLNGRALAYRAKVDVSSMAADVQGYRTSILRVTPALQVLVPVATGDRIALLLGPSLGCPFFGRPAMEPPARSALATAASPWRWPG